MLVISDWLSAISYQPEEEKDTNSSTFSERSERLWLIADS
jgi:hypothetical protein